MYEPDVLSMAAAIVSPSWRVAGVAPCRRMRETFPDGPVDSHVIVYGDPPGSCIFGQY